MTKESARPPLSAGTRLAAMALALALIAVPACGDEDNSLTGSIEDSYSLDFDSVSVRQQGTDLIIEYIKKLTDGASSKVVKLVIDTDGAGLGGGKKLSGQAFLDRVTVTRVTNELGDFPAVKSGAVEFSTYQLKQGGTMDGKFEVVFEIGRTLSGTFKGKVEVVSLD